MVRISAGDGIFDERTVYAARRGWRIVPASRFRNICTSAPQKRKRFWYQISEWRHHFGRDLTTYPAALNVL
jgi:hypothetical protein